MSAPVFAAGLSAFLALSILLGLLVAPALKHARETQTIEVELVIPEPETGDFALIRPDEVSAFILGERMRLAFRTRQPKPVDEFTTRLEWAFATGVEGVRQ